MQIIIIQTEIEEAIRNHILNQIAIKDDQRIDIDLRATRGSDGFQAVIDIVSDTTPVRAPVQAQPDLDPPVEAKPAKAPTAVRAAPTKTVKATLPAAVKAAVEAPLAEEESDVLPDAEQEPDMSAEADAGQLTIAEGDQSVAEIAAEAPAKKPSLFANMKKPDNA